MTIDEIRQLILQSGITDPSGSPVASGEISGGDGLPKSFQLYLGWDVVIANQCDKTWGAFNIGILRHVQNLGLDDQSLETTLASLQLEDAHWDWLAKSATYRSDEYKWFFMMAEGYPQAACLIYHPKPSAIDDAGIYYIEYLAVAPWNRVNPLAQRAFKGVGTEMIALVSSYATKHLGLRPGFSLHALPKAVGYYQSIGMAAFPELDKDGLPYFEMPADKCPLAA